MSNFSDGSIVDVPVKTNANIIAILNSNVL